MQRTPWLNVLVILLTIIAALYLLQLLWSILGLFADVILLFVLAWVLAFALGPVIEGISGKTLPTQLGEFAGGLFGPRIKQRIEQFRFSRLQAVTIIYLGFTIFLMLVIASLVPTTVTQINQVASQFPALANQAPDYARDAQNALAGLGLRFNVESAVLAALGGVQSFATLALQNALVILTALLGLIGNFLFILLLSFFFALDGPRLLRAIFEIVPEEYRTEMGVLVLTIDRAFGGFIRAQLLQALMISAGTAIVLGIFGEPFILVATLFTFLFMIIPLFGPILALGPPLLATLSHNPNQVLPVLILLLAYQLVVVNFVMPKMLSDALGLHPLVIISSLLIGIRVGGFWGAFFGVPVAGVISTMALFFYRRWARTAAPPPVQARPAPAPAPAASAVLPSSSKQPPAKEVHNKIPG